MNMCVYVCIYHLLECFAFVATFLGIQGSKFFLIRIETSEFWLGSHTNLLRLNEQTLRRENSFAFSRKMDCDVDASVEMKFFFVKGT